MNELYLFGITYDGRIDYVNAAHCRFCQRASCATYCGFCADDGWWGVETIRNAWWRFAK